MIYLTATGVTIDAAAPDGTPKRTITGTAVPWNVTATVGSGQRVRFLPGSLPTDGPPPKLCEQHNPAELRGIVTERVATDEGMMFAARIAGTRAGDDALELLKMGAYDAVSVGAEPLVFHFEDDVMVIEQAAWPELSLVTHGAFSGAIIDTVAATAPTDKEPTVTATATAEPTDTATEPTPTPALPIYATAARAVTLPTAAEYIAANAAGGDRWAAMVARVRAAAPDVLTTDTAGILPTPIVGPVYNNFSGRRPVIDACGTKAMPGGGKVFIRPEVTTHTSMAVQSAENAALQTGTLVVTSNQVTKATYGGYVTISNQDIDWTDPNVVSLILDDMARIYGNTTDNVAADALVAAAATTRNFTAANIADPTDWVQWAYGAASTILSASNGNLPTHLFMDPATWASLGALEDTAGRALFPQLGPMNAYGNLAPGQPAGTAFGLQVVVDRNFAASTLIIGDPMGFEIFEQVNGALSMTAPDTISRTVSWHGYFATLMIDAACFVKAAFV